MADGIVKRKSAKFKAGLVMRHIKGETLDILAREAKVTPGEIYGWHERFLTGANEYLSERPNAKNSKELAEAQSTIGRLTMQVEALKKKMNMN